jgi:protein O-mannosyl-transferase
MKNSEKNKRRNRTGNSLREVWRSYGIVLCAGLLVYVWTIPFGFTHCDDDSIIVENHEQIRDFSRVSHAFTDSFGGLYRPILQVSFIADAVRGGTDPHTYHLSNVIYHLVASLLVLAVLRRLIDSERAALFLSLFFTCHPLLVQAVVWIPGRNDLIVTIFVLLSFVGLDSLAKNNRPLWYAVHFSAFCLALFSKESAAFFPLLCIFYLVAFKKERIFSRRMLILASGWTGLGILWLVARFSAGDILSHPNEIGVNAFLKSYPALPALLGKLILPLRLSGLATFDPLSITAGIVLAAVAVSLAFILKKSDRRMLLLGLLWYLLFLLPTLFYRVKGADDHYDYLEHRAYLPMLGFLLVAGEFLPRLGVSFRKRPVQILSVVLLVLLSAGSIVYSRSFKDEMTFWQAAKNADPERANFHSVLGELFFKRGEIGKAEACFLRAKDVSVGGDPFIDYNLGIVYKKKKEPEKALAMLGQAVAAQPDNPLFVFSLGKAFFENNRLDDAEKQFLKTIALEPRYFQAYVFLVGLYDRTGRLEKAVETCHALLDAEPGYSQALHFLVELYSKQRKWDKVAEIREKIVEIEPASLPIREWLMKHYLEVGKLDAARRHGMEILKRGGTIPAGIRERIAPR